MNKQLFNRVADIAKDQTRIELALVQELERNADIAKNQLIQLQRLAARMEYNFRQIEDMANKVGVELNSKTIEAGKFFRELENKLK